MANYHAGYAVCEAVVRLLHEAYRGDRFAETDLEFKVYGASDLDAPPSEGVSLFLYRVETSQANRPLHSRPRADGSREKPPLYLDLHFLLTVWARQASTQNTIAAWMMRVLEDTPTLTPDRLNQVRPDLFSPVESVDLVMADLTTRDLLDLWDRLSPKGWRLSVPYIARGVRIDSGQSAAGAPPVGG